METLLGRKRYFPRLATTTDYNLRRREEREAINAPIQGTAADIMKLAMLAVEKQLRASNHSAKILLQVHDELVLEVPEKEVTECYGTGTIRYGRSIFTGYPADDRCQYREAIGDPYLD